MIPEALPPLWSGTVPLRTRSSANLREHWAVRRKRVKLERDAAIVVPPADAWSAVLPVAYAREDCPFLEVHLVRIIPPRGKCLDDDNLRSAFKGLRDGIADRLGVDDADPRVRWVYHPEERGKEWAVRIEIRQMLTPSE